MDIRGKVAIVTGASRGIGRQLALELGRRGVMVALAARTVEARRALPGTLGETLADIEVAGGRAIGVPTDVANPQDIERLVEKTLEAFGRVDFLINNAAATGAQAQPLGEYSWDSWMSQFNVNVHGPFWAMRTVVPHMAKQGGGIIVNVTSKEAQMEAIQDGAFDDPTRSELGVLIGYRATKAALNRLTNAVADQLARQNITATLVDPGYTQTEKTQLLADRGLVTLEGSHSADYPVAKIIEVLTADKPLAYAGKVLLGYPTGDKG